MGNSQRTTPGEYDSFIIMAPPPAGIFQPDIAKADTVLWKEALFAADLLLLHSSPVYYRLGVPYGDRSAGRARARPSRHAHLSNLDSWLGRIGYRPYFSASDQTPMPQPPHPRRLNESIDKALLDTGKKST